MRKVSAVICGKRYDALVSLSIADVLGVEDAFNEIDELSEGGRLKRGRCIATTFPYSGDKGGPGISYDEKRQMVLRAREIFRA